MAILNPRRLLLACTLGLLVISAAACGDGVLGPGATETPSEATPGAKARGVQGEIAYSFSPLSAPGTAIYLADVATGAVRPLVTNAETSLSWRPISWSPDGKRLAVCDGSALWIVKSDGTAGEAIVAGCQSIAWSPEGSRIAFVGPSQQNRRLYTVRPDGADLIEVGGSFGAFGEPSWSPDGKRFVFQMDDGLYVANAEGESAEPLILLDETYVDSPRWSPSGETIVYSAFPQEPKGDGADGGVFVIRSDGGEPRRLPVTSFQRQFKGLLLWSPDGTEIGYVSESSEGYELRAIDPQGNGDRKVAGPFLSIEDFAWSPDGDALAVLEAGDLRRTEIFVVEADGSGSYQLTFDGIWKRYVAWAPEPVPEPLAVARVDLAELPKPTLPAPSETPHPSEITPPEGTPTPGGAPIPPRPVALEQYAEVIERYLTANRGTSDCLLELTQEWGMPSEPRFGLGRRCIQGPWPWPADTNGDGRDEIILAVEDPGTEPYPLNPPGDLLIFSAVGGRYEAVFSASAQLGEELANVSAVDVRDIDESGGVEVVFTSNWMGAHTLSTSVFVVGWDGRIYRRLTPEGLGITYPTEIRFSPWIGSERPLQWGLVLRGDTIGSAGAGVQRQKTYFYIWNGESFELAMKASDPSPFLYFAVLDANEAFAEGSYWSAVGRYRQAIGDESLLDLDPYPGIPSEQAEGRGRDELLAFAHFRLGLSYLRLGDEDAALQAIAAATKEYAETWHGKAASRFLDSFEASGDEAEACAAMTAFAESNADSFRPLWDYGYGNPYFEPQSLCLEPGLASLYWSLHEWR